MLHGFEGFVGFFEWECDDTRMEVETVHQGDEVARILARHVGDAANLTLSPEQLVVIEAGIWSRWMALMATTPPFAQGDNAQGRPCRWVRK